MSFIKVTTATHRETNKKVSTISPFPIEEEIKKHDPDIKAWNITEELIWN